jgi:hypothetical protein
LSVGFFSPVPSVLARIPGMASRAPPPRTLRFHPVLELSFLRFLWWSRERSPGHLAITPARDDRLGTLFLAAPPEGVISVTIYRRHRADPEFITYRKGRVSAARCSGATVQLKCE